MNCAHGMCLTDSSLSIVKKQIKKKKVRSNNDTKRAIKRNTLKREATKSNGKNVAFFLLMNTHRPCHGLYARQKKKTMWTHARNYCIRKIRKNKTENTTTTTKTYVLEYIIHVGFSMKMRLTIVYFAFVFVSIDKIGFQSTGKPEN